MSKTNPKTKKELESAITDIEGGLKSSFTPEEFKPELLSLKVEFEEKLKAMNENKPAPKEKAASDKKIAASVVKKEKIAPDKKVSPSKKGESKEELLQNIADIDGAIESSLIPDELIPELLSLKAEFEEKLMAWDTQELPKRKPAKKEKKEKVSDTPKVESRKYLLESIATIEDFLSSSIKADELRSELKVVKAEFEEKLKVIYPEEPANKEQILVDSKIMTKNELLSKIGDINKELRSVLTSKELRAELLVLKAEYENRLKEIKKRKEKDIELLMEYGLQFDKEIATFKEKHKGNEQILDGLFKRGESTVSYTTLQIYGFDFKELKSHTEYGSSILLSYTTFENKVFGSYELIYVGNNHNGFEFKINQL